jgi:hypothetical protein
MWGRGGGGSGQADRIHKVHIHQSFFKDKAIQRTQNNQSRSFLLFCILVTAPEQSKFMTYILNGALLPNAAYASVTKRKCVPIT